MTEMECSLVSLINISYNGSVVMSDIERGLREKAGIDIADSIIMAVILPGEGEIRLTIKKVSGNIERINILLGRDTGIFTGVTYCKIVDKLRISPVEYTQIKGDLILVDIFKQATREMARRRMALLIMAIVKDQMPEEEISKEQLKILCKLCVEEYVDFITQNEGEVSIIIRKVVKLSRRGVSTKHIICVLKNMRSCLSEREGYFKEKTLLTRFLEYC